MNENKDKYPLSDEEIKLAADSLESKVVDATDKVVGSFKVGERRGGKKIGLMRSEPKRNPYRCDGLLCPEEQSENELFQDVALNPNEVAKLVELGHVVFVQAGAGKGAGYPDEAYTSLGANLVYSDEKILNDADFVLKAGELTLEEADNLKAGKVVFAKLRPTERREIVESILKSGATVFALERFRAFDSGTSRCEGFDLAWERSDSDERQISEQLISILNDGVQVACADNQDLRTAIISFEGKLTDEKTGSANGMKWVEPTEALGIKLWTLK